MRVTLLITVEKSPLLCSMQRIIGCIQIQNNLFRRPLMTIHKNVDKGVVYKLGMVNYFFISSLFIGIRFGKFKLGTSFAGTTI